jgi:hypothetical protein
VYNGYTRVPGDCLPVRLSVCLPVNQALCMPEVVTYF